MRQKIIQLHWTKKWVRISATMRVTKKKIVHGFHELQKKPNFSNFEFTGKNMDTGFCLEELNYILPENR